MAANPARASLVVKEYRYIESPSLSESAAIRAKFDNAPLIEITTNLDAASAQVLANEVAAQVCGLAERRTFTFEFEGALMPEDLIGGVPRYILDFTRHVTAGLGTYALIEARPIFDRDVTLVKVRAE